MSRSGIISRVVGYTLPVALVCGVIYAVMNRQYITDQIIVWKYEPARDIVAVNERVKFTDKGEFLFYASQPDIDGTQAFNTLCDRRESQTAILGCYAAGRIYIYDVTDKKLDGIKEVTAAHEMLHAAYERLDEAEKTRVNNLLEAEYKRIDNAKLTKRMEFYARTEPGERLNELHSIIGTEFNDLSSELESYYGQYFADRSHIVELYSDYEAVFSALQTESESLASQITALVADINSQSKSYNADVQQLNQDIIDFNRRARTGQFASSAEFDTERAKLQARRDQLERERQAINAKIERYDTLRARLQEVNSQSEALNNSIDSSLAPAPSV